MEYRLGKLPARNQIKFAFANYFDLSALPKAPKTFGHPYAIKTWKMLANDKVGNCVFAGAAHETMMWSKVASNKLTNFNDESVISDYAALTGYNPNSPASDQGTDVLEAASYRRKTGIIDSTKQRHLIYAYASLKTGNVSQLAVAAYAMGAVGVGLQFPASAFDQFQKHQAWYPVKKSTIEGGHYVPCIGRDNMGNFIIITWGQLAAMTPEFVMEYMDEGIGYISFEYLNNMKLTPENFNLAQLENDLLSLGRLS